MCYVISSDWWENFFNERFITISIDEYTQSIDYTQTFHGFVNETNIYQTKGTWKTVYYLFKLAKYPANSVFIKYKTLSGCLHNK